MKINNDVPQEFEKKEDSKSKKQKRRIKTEGKIMIYKKIKQKTSKE